MTAYQIEHRPVSSLVPYEGNARTHSSEQIDKLAASIREFGFTSPILIDPNGMVLAGHGRLMAARLAGLAKVPTLTVGDDWGEEKIRAYILADNQLAIFGSGWDKDLLALELKEISHAGYDLGLTGFDENYIEQALSIGEIEAPKEFSEFDEGIATEHACPKCGFKWSGKTS